MTPEEEHELQLLMEQSAPSGGDLLPVLDYAESMDVPPPPAMERERAQPMNLPPPLPIPERGDPHSSGTDRGRKAHRVISALLKPVLGVDSYGQRFAQEEAVAEQRYRDAKERYAMGTADRDRAIKEQMMLRPIPDTIAETYGLPPGSTMADLQPYQQTGYTSLVRQREGAQNALGLEGAKQTNRLTLQEQRAADQLAAIEARNRGRGKGKGGGGGGSGRVAPKDRVLNYVDQGTYDQGMNDIRNGNAGSPAAVKVRDGYVQVYGEDYMKYLKPDLDIGEDYRKRSDQETDALRKDLGNRAEIRSALNGWNSFRRANRDQIDTYVKELAGNWSGTDTSLSDGARRMREAIRAPIATYLGKKAGAAMSENEATLYGGPAGRLIVGNNRSFFSAEGLESRISGALTNGQIDVNDLLDLVGNIERGVRAEDANATAGRPIEVVSRVADEETVKKTAASRVYRAVREGKVKPPEPGMKIKSIRTDGGEIVFTWANGQEGRIPGG